MGGPFWGLVIYSIVFIGGYFIWALTMNAKEDKEKE